MTLFQRWAVFFRQLHGIVAATNRYHGTLPAPETFHTTVSYRLPFQGSWTVLNGGITQATSHTWELPSQRYAYDFLIADAQGNSFQGPEERLSSFYCYGQPILSPAHGIVIAAVDGAPDSPVCSPRKAVCAAKDLRGNYLLLQHRPREYSLLAHLKPGSLLVRQGESVRQGQPVAACGNSGNSSEPHLHFQLQDTPDFYTSAGLPIPFSSLRTAPAPNYHRLDPRPHGAETTPPPYLTRGQQVSPLPPP